ncbi:hypothetical protein PIROE2DRAFT_8340 [Piromyces sp. E2]|nr:hypothetical protein PIROE2DRAFT_8340 [Piromyces sp. E2]|eukprot:OUM64798.1 hypothetical protein PIROE2DRAFT_8340 [Piromyces sp. E2]
MFREKTCFGVWNVNQLKTHNIVRKNNEISNYCKNMFKALRWVDYQGYNQSEVDKCIDISINNPCFYPECYELVSSTTSFPFNKDKLWKCLDRWMNFFQLYMKKEDICLGLLRDYNTFTTADLGNHSCEKLNRLSLTVG